MIDPALSETMHKAIACAREHGGELVRYLGGRWTWRDDPSSPWSSFGTPTINALVARGVAEFSEWKEGRSGRFPITMRLVEVKQFYIVSLEHTDSDHRYICFWRAKNSGYAWPLMWAGIYSREMIEGALNYYNNGEKTIAVRCDAVDVLAVDPRPGDIDGDAGPVVMNTSANWRALLAGVVYTPRQPPRPRFKGARVGHD